MIVLHIITAINVGGAETMLCKYLENKNSEGTKHVVLSLMKPGPKAAGIKALGIPVYTLGMKRWFPGPVEALRLVRLVNIIRPDVLHGWMYHGNLAASFAHFASAFNVPLVWNVRHSLADPKRESWRTRILLKVSAAISRRPSAIIYNSAAAAIQHRDAGYAPEKAVVLPNGFDFDLFRPNGEARKRLNLEYGIDPGAILVGKIARLHPMKDHAMLVEAVALARAQGHDLHLLMMGEGLAKPPDDLQQQIDRLLPANRITLIGGRSDVADLLPGLDILALSSAWGEGFPNVIGESLACQVPVVATDVGDSAAIVADSGIIALPGDTEAFSNALVEMAALGPAGRRSLGFAGRNRAKANYGLAEVSARYDKLHNDLVSQTDGSLMKAIMRDDTASVPRL
jgi:glycosyltransferase involved in cell wall biosynthesis